MSVNNENTRRKYLSKIEIMMFGEERRISLVKILQEKFPHLNIVNPEYIIHRGDHIYVYISGEKNVGISNDDAGEIYKLLKDKFGDDWSLTPFFDDREPEKGGKAR